MAGKHRETRHETSNKNVSLDVTLLVFYLFLKYNSFTPFSHLTTLRPCRLVRPSGGRGLQPQNHLPVLCPPGLCSFTVLHLKSSKGKGKGTKRYKRTTWNYHYQHYHYNIQSCCLHGILVSARLLMFGRLSCMSSSPRPYLKWHRALA